MKTKLLFFAGFVLSGSLFAQVPTPVGDWPFDANLNDATETFTASTPGNVTIVDDAVRGKVAYFPGTNVANADSLNRIDLDLGIANFDALTYNIWYLVELKATWCRVITLSTANPDGLYPEFFITPYNGRFGADSMTFTVDAGRGNDGLGVDDTGVEICADIKTEVETWYMVTASQDETHLKFWVNGVPVADSIQTSGKPSSLLYRVAWLGKAGWPDPMFKGKMDNFKVFDKVLSDAEVAAVYANEVTTGINPVINEFDMVIYPYHNQLIINNPDNATINSIQIYNMTGGLVYQTNTFVRAIDHNLPPNLYIIKVKSNLGDYVTKVAIK